MASHRVGTLLGVAFIALSQPACGPLAAMSDGGVDGGADALVSLDAPVLDGGRGDVGPLTRPRDAPAIDALDAGPCGDCSLLEGPCTSAHCDPTELRCVLDYAEVGAPCDDDNVCTTTETCDAIGACMGTPVATGASCDDGDACTQADACTSAGLCRGTPVDCSALDRACQVGVCRMGACVASGRADCSACAGDPTRVCLAGACVASSPIAWTFDAGLPASWQSAGDASWVAAPGAGRLGGTALTSGALGDSRTAEAILRLTTSVPVDLTFSYRVSSEEGWDFFRVYVDNEPMARVSASGDSGWRSASVALNMFAGGPAEHTVRFVYDKDGSLGALEDRALIDEVRLVRRDVTSMVVVGPGPVRERFEGPDLPAGARTSAGPAAWFIDASESYEGDGSAASGVIPDSTGMGMFTISDLDLDVTSAAGEGIEVWVRTSTENNYDFFELRVDGSLGARLSGVHDWTRLTAPLGAAGDHVVTLRYTKDYSIAGPEDRVWVDALRVGPIEGEPVLSSPCR